MVAHAQLLLDGLGQQRVLDLKAILSVWAVIYGQYSKWLK
jgi:hypothetical protein